MFPGHPALQIRRTSTPTADKGRTGHSASLGRSSGRVFGASGRRAFGDDVPATATVVEFTRVWWDFNSGAHSRLSVWRPTCPRGVCLPGRRRRRRAAAARVHGRRPDAPGRSATTPGFEPATSRGVARELGDGVARLGLASAGEKSRHDFLLETRSPRRVRAHRTRRERLARAAAARYVRVPPRGSGDDRPEGGFRARPGVDALGSGVQTGAKAPRDFPRRARLTSSPPPPARRKIAQRGMRGTLRPRLPAARYLPRRERGRNATWAAPGAAAWRRRMSRTVYRFQTRGSNRRTALLSSFKRRFQTARFRPRLLPGRWRPRRWTSRRHAVRRRSRERSRRYQKRSE